MYLQSMWQTLQDLTLAEWGAVAAVAPFTAAVVYRLIIKPIRNRLARRRDEKKVVRNLLRFLENRRVLYCDYAYEHVSDVINSVHQIRNRLGEDIETLDGGSDAARPVREMQGACRTFLSQIGSLPGLPEGQITHTERFMHALMEMRTTFDSRTNDLCEG
jgi:hypothetical protein